MSKASVSPSQIIRITGNDAIQAADLLAAEEPLEIRIGFGPHTQREQKSISVTMRTPGHDFELALGFLFTEGIIASQDEITQIRYCTELNTKDNLENIVRVELRDDVTVDLTALQRNFYTTSSCGVCGKASIEAIKTVCPAPVPHTFTISKSIITGLPAKLRENQNVFEHTGGLHAAALFDLNGSLLLLREDVGRHNALDKLIGAGKAAGTTFSNNILLLSGRASFELIQKAAMAGIPVVCAVGAPSSLAAGTAKEFGICLVGFLREERFNIYTFPERILY